MSHTLLILKIYPFFKMFKWCWNNFLVISTGFRFSKLKWGSVPSIPVAYPWINLLSKWLACSIRNWLPCSHCLSKSSSNVWGCWLVLDVSPAVLLPASDWLAVDAVLCKMKLHNHIKNSIITYFSPKTAFLILHIL